jgi:hypothetical protein
LRPFLAFFYLKAVCACLKFLSSIVWAIISVLSDEKMSNDPYGQNYQPQPPLPPPLPPQLPPKKEEGIGKYVLLIGGGCLLLLIFAGAIGFFVYYIFNATSDPLKVVNLQLESMRESNLEKAYSYCSSGFKENTNYVAFQSFVNGNPQLKGSKEFTSNSREIEQGIAKLKGNLVTTSGTSSPAEYHLVREGKAWKVQYIDLGATGTAKNTGNEPSRDPIPTNEEPQRDNPSEAYNRNASTGALRIDEIRVEQQPQGNVSSVTIRFKVYGFQLDKSSATPKMHLIQDLKTFDPDGNVIPDLSRDAIKDLEDSGDYAAADMWNTLTIPTSFARGTYRCELTVHDKIGGGDTTSSTQFDLQ